MNDRHPATQIKRKNHFPLSHIALSYAFVLERVIDGHRARSDKNDSLPEIMGVGHVSVIVFLQILAVFLIFQRQLSATFIGQFMGTFGGWVSLIIGICVAVSLTALPGSRYRRWSAKLKSESRIAREQPVKFMILAYTIVVAWVVGGLIVYLLRTQ